MLESLQTGLYGLTARVSYLFPQGGPRVIMLLVGATLL